jgi:hypothetical protein
VQVGVLDRAQCCENLLVCDAHPLLLVWEDLERRYGDARAASTVC